MSRFKNDNESLRDFVIKYADDIILAAEDADRLEAILQSADINDLPSVGDRVLRAEAEDDAAIYIDEDGNVTMAIVEDETPKRVRFALGTLEDLRDAIVTDILPQDITHDLPTYGGEEPEDTLGVWSWNEDEVLVGTGKALRIVDRDEIE